LVGYIKCERKLKTPAEEQFIKAYVGYQELGDSFTAHNCQVALKRIQANDYTKYKDDLHCIHKGEYL
jgi:hypothetical protein